jgi:hypothetical protein
MIEEILTKPFLFYTDIQRINFLKKVKDLCEAYNNNGIIIRQIKNKINNLKILISI